MTARPSSHLLALPFGVLADNVLPNLEAVDLAKLRLVSRELKELVDDELLWKHKINEDYNLPPHATARVSGFQRLYKGLTRPRVFVWGDKTNCRLGTLPSQLRPDVANLIDSQGGSPFPLHLDYSQAGGLDALGAPVEIVAGGWSFHVLTSKGQIIFWGTLDGSMYSLGDDLQDSNTRIQTPRLLTKSSPESVKSISSGRSHAVALTSEGNILEWHNWSNAVLHEPLLQVTSSDGTAYLEQIEAGWDFTVALVHSRDQYANARGSSPRTSELVYWHNDWVANESQMEQVAETGGYRYIGVRRVTLPPLPRPSQAVLDEMRDDEDDDLAGSGTSHRHQLITKIGAGEQWVVALTASGLVYRLQTTLPFAQRTGDGDLHPSQLLTQMFRNGVREWQLMEEFCLPSHMAQLSTFAQDDKLRAMVTPDVRITHISAQFRNFVAYSPRAGASSSSDSITAGDSPSGIVLLGGGQEAEKRADAKPELQGIGVIKVSMGDWHYGALTASGQVLTWGSWSNGALGTWDSLPRVEGRPRGGPTPTGPVDRMRQIRGGRGVRTMPMGRIGFAGRGLYRGGASNLVRFGASGRIDESGNRVPDNEDANGDGEASQSRPATGSEQDDLTGREEWEERLEARVVPWQGGIDSPTEVIFDPAARRGGHDSNFIFDIAFAGWHSSAIAIDTDVLDPKPVDDTASEQTSSSSSTTAKPTASFHALQQRGGTQASLARDQPLTSFDPETEVLHRIRNQQRARSMFMQNAVWVVCCLAVTVYLNRFSADEQQDADLPSEWRWPGILTFSSLLIPLGLYAVIVRWVGERLWRFS